MIVRKRRGLDLCVEWDRERDGVRGKYSLVYDGRCGKFLQKVILLLGIHQRQFNGVLKFAVTVKIGGSDTFSRCKSKDAGYLLVTVGQWNCAVEDG